jgi:hypothetical protein
MSTTTYHDEQYDPQLQWVIDEVIFAMNKVPPVERDKSTGGLTMSCAGLWCQFLSEEFDWQGNRSLSEYYKRRSQELSSSSYGLFT